MTCIFWIIEHGKLRRKTGGWMGCNYDIDEVDPIMLHHPQLVIVFGYTVYPCTPRVISGSSQMVAYWDKLALQYQLDHPTHGWKTINICNNTWKYWKYIERIQYLKSAKNNITKNEINTSQNPDTDITSLHWLSLLQLWIGFRSVFHVWVQFLLLCWLLRQQRQRQMWGSCGCEERRREEIQMLA